MITCGRGKCGSTLIDHQLLGLLRDHRNGLHRRRPRPDYGNLFTAKVDPFMRPESGLISLPLVAISTRDIGRF